MFYSLACPGRLPLDVNLEFDWMGLDLGTGFLRRDSCVPLVGLSYPVFVVGLRVRWL